MIVSRHAARGPLFFCYAKPEGFSGQKAATELVRDGLAARGWCCWELAQPVFDRAGGRLGVLRYGWQVLVVWLKSARLLFSRRGRLWVGLGQTRVSFLRDSIPLLFGRWGLGRQRVVVSLNGSLFMAWKPDCLDARLFRFLLAQAGTVTVVGDRQREKLLGLDVPGLRVRVVVNSCTLRPLTASELDEKIAAADSTQAPVRCLFLSSLIDTKGYPEYLQALHRIAALPGRRVEAVLCGRLVASEFSDRFRDEQEAAAWIEACLVEVNRGRRVSVRWVKGASGAPKEELFHSADIFVLPTRYAVEAQPLVLLEAMAAGCAIITTSVAEIPTILGPDCAVLLANGDTEQVAGAMQRIVESSGVRGRLARAAHARFRKHYQPAQHLDVWEHVLGRPVVAAVRSHEAVHG